MDGEHTYRQRELLRRTLPSALVVALVLSCSLSLFSLQHQHPSETFCGISERGGARPGAGFPIQFLCDIGGGYSGGERADLFDLNGGLKFPLFLLNTAIYFLPIALLFTRIGMALRANRSRARSLSRR